MAKVQAEGAEGAEGRLYWDEGEGEGPYRLDRFRLLPAEGGFRLLWQGKGELPWPWARVRLRLFGKRLLRAHVEGEAHAAEEGGVLLPPFREALLEVEG